MTPGLRTLAVYVAAGATYVTIGVFFPRAVLSWVEGAAFLLLVVAVLPTLVNRLRR